MPIIIGISYSSMFPCDTTEISKTTNIKMIKLKNINFPIFLKITKLKYLYIQIFQK